MRHHEDSGALADAPLGAWLREVRAHPPQPLAERLADARAPRARQAGPELAEVRDVRVPGLVPMRLYRPAADPLPLVVFVHGGYFVLGDLDSHDRACRRLALAARAAVLALEYRLAPEHPAPAAVGDVVACLAWAAGAPPQLGALLPGDAALAGDSAGGALAVLAAAELIARGRKPGPLLLLNPNADLTLSAPSVQAKGTGWGLESADVRWAVAQWAPSPSDRARYSPVAADLSGLGHAVVATSEHDPLRDEGVALVARLRACGVAVEHVDVAGMIHGFINLDTVSPAARRAGEELMTAFGRLLQHT